jgi:type III secretory pathway component EscU
VVLLTAASIGHVCFPTVGVAMQELVASSFRYTGLRPATAATEISPAVIRVAQEVLRIAAACWAAALAADLAQVGFVWSPVTLLPHEERVSPISGIARILSWPTLERASLLTLKVLVALIIIGLVSLSALRSTFTGSGVGAGDSQLLWGLAARWTCLGLAITGAGCLLTGVVDAWIRQSRWRLSVEQTDDERRRGE